jgi:hypothetical protein
MVTQVAEMFSDSVLSMALVLNRTLKQDLNVTNLSGITDILNLISIIVVAFEFLVAGMFLIDLPGLLILGRWMTISLISSSIA